MSIIYVRETNITVSRQTGTGNPFSVSNALAQPLRECNDRPELRPKVTHVRVDPTNPHVDQFPWSKREVRKESCLSATSVVLRWWLVLVESRPGLRFRPVELPITRYSTSWINTKGFDFGKWLLYILMYPSGLSQGTRACGQRSSNDTGAMPRTYLGPKKQANGDKSHGC